MVTNFTNFIINGLINNNISKQKVPRRLEHAVVANGPRIKFGVNKPCPCGSGKKFKRCHGQPQEIKDEHSDVEK